jgi:predicted XRE-type DNA-binding protein
MKEVRWHGSSRSDVEAFPNDARREAGYQLFQVQIGENPSDWKTHAVHRPRQSTAQTDQVTIMARSVFHDLFPEEEAAELEMRAKLLSGINKWLSKSGLTQTEAAEQLGVTQARVSEIKNGKINRFSLSMLVRLARRAGLRPGIKLQKAA